MMVTVGTRATSGYADNLGLRLLRGLADEGRYVFTVEEAKAVAVQLGISEGYLRLLLFRLARSGWVVRLRRGLYASMSGTPWEVQVHPFVVATRLVSPSAVSHWSAMSHHGLTEQIPQAVTAFTTQKVVTPSMRSGRAGKKPGAHAWEVAGIRYEYTTVEPEHFFGIEEVWVDQFFRVPITDRERTMLEGFISPRMFGGMSEVLGILDEHAHELELQKLVDYALRYGKASVIKRLGWSLEQVGTPADLLKPLEEVPVSGFRVLDPTRPERGPCDTRWRIQNNLAVAAA
jgi:predicted transcriptional regulator of viral defense system